MDKTQNPGEKLRGLLIKLIPNDSNFPRKIDDFVNADGELEALLYQSTINYLLRRLITSADYLRRKLDRDDDVFEKELAKLIERTFRVKRPSENFDKLVILVKESLKAKDKKINTRAKRMELKKQGQTSCYICSQEVDLFQFIDSRDDSLSSVRLSGDNSLFSEVEHLWPRSLGGSSEFENLKIVCRQCNRQKEDFLDTSDYHYEHLCLITDEEDQDAFQQEKARLRKFEIAILHRNDFCCYNCSQPVTKVGPLRLVRREQRDSWHLLNVEAICQRCYNQQYRRQ